MATYHRFEQGNCPVIYLKTLKRSQMGPRGRKPWEAVADLRNILSKYLEI